MKFPWRLNLVSFTSKTHTIWHCKFLFALFLTSIFHKNISAQFFESKTHRSSDRRCSIKKGVLKNVTKFTWKQPWQSLLWILWNFSEHLFYITPPVAASVRSNEGKSRKVLDRNYFKREIVRGVFRTLSNI